MIHEFMLSKDDVDRDYPSIVNSEIHPRDTDRGTKLKTNLSGEDIITNQDSK